MSAFILVSLAHTGLIYTDMPEGVLRAIGVVGGVLAAVTLFNTGVLLPTVPTIPLWRTPTLPLLFVVSGISAGIMTVSLLHSIVLFLDATRDGAFYFSMMAEYSLLVAGSTLLVIEAVVIIGYLGLVRTVPAGKASVDSLINGEHTLVFWSLCVAMGLIFPLCIQLAGAFALDDNPVGMRLSAAVLTAVPAGLLGGYLLRHLIMAAAIKRVPNS